MAAVALLLVLAPQLIRMVQDSRESADWRNLDGVRAAIDSLRPGLTVNLTYGSMSTGDRVTLGGRQFACSYGDGTITFPSRWQLSNESLSASAHQLLRLTGGLVEVVQTG